MLTLPLVNQMLIYVFGTQVSIMSTGFFQERLFTLGYYNLNDHRRSDSFEDKNFIVFIMRIFVLTLLAAHFLLKRLNLLASPSVPQSFQICLIITLLSSIGSIFGLSIENTVRSANDGSEIFLMFWLILSLSASGFIALFLFKNDEYFSKVSNKKFQMMLAMNVMNLATSFHAIYEQKTIDQSLQFLLTHPIFAQDLLILCISEAVGQFFIYLTIEKFGFIAFGLSLISRQILTAAFAYFYPVTTFQITAIFGFLSLFSSLLLNFRNEKQIKIE